MILWQLIMNLKKNNIGTNNNNNVSKQLINPIIANRDRGDMYINIGLISSIKPRRIRFSG